ncbi:MAG: hypothetical protein R3F34_02975 [Planctomycetota bacterium]
MSAEVVEFINAIDEFKRRNMLAHLPLERVLDVVHELGYRCTEKKRPAEIAKVTGALDLYKREHKRLFPNWSEVFEVLQGLGYQRR